MWKGGSEIFVIDSSFILSLSKIDRVDLLEKLDTEIICPPRVYSELVTEGLEHGYSDAIIIKRKFFDSGLVRQERVKKDLAIKGVARTDSEVISLANEWQATLLVEDSVLVRKATQTRVRSLTLPQLVLGKVSKGQIAKKEFRHLIKELVRNNRLSPRNAKKYLGVVENEN